MKDITKDVVIEGSPYRVRLKERRVIEAEILSKGEVVSIGQAWCRPEDVFNEGLGTKIAVGRAVRDMCGLVEDRKGATREVLEQLESPLSCSTEWVTNWLQEWERNHKSWKSWKARAPLPEMPKWWHEAERHSTGLGGLQEASQRPGVGKETPTVKEGPEGLRIKPYPPRSKMLRNFLTAKWE